MKRRQPLPRVWLMTDERQGDGLWGALERLPRGAGMRAFFCGFLVETAAAFVPKTRMRLTPRSS